MHSEPLRAFRAVARNARRPGGVAGPASREGAWTVTLYSRAPAKIHRTRHGYVNKLIFVVNDACGVAKGPLGVFEAISGIAPRARALLRRRTGPAGAAAPGPPHPSLAGGPETSGSGDPSCPLCPLAIRGHGGAGLCRTAWNS